MEAGLTKQEFIKYWCDLRGTPEELRDSDGCESGKYRRVAVPCIDCEYSGCQGWVMEYANETVEAGLNFTFVGESLIRWKY
jgi:hypothetical protein